MGQPISSNQYNTIGEILDGAVKPKNVGVFHPANTRINAPKTQTNIQNPQNNTVSRKVGGPEIQPFNGNRGLHPYTPENLILLGKMGFTAEDVSKLLKIKEEEISKSFTKPETVTSIEQTTERNNHLISYDIAFKKHIAKIIARGINEYRTKEPTVIFSPEIENLSKTPEVKGKAVLRAGKRSGAYNPTVRKIENIFVNIPKEEKPQEKIAPEILQKALEETVVTSQITTPEPLETESTPLKEPTTVNEIRGAKTPTTSPFLQRTGSILSENNIEGNHSTKPVVNDQTNNEFSTKQVIEEIEPVENEERGELSAETVATNQKSSESSTGPIVAEIKPVETTTSKEKILGIEKKDEPNVDELTKKQKEATKNVLVSHTLHTRIKNIMEDFKKKGLESKKFFMIFLFPIASAAAFTQTPSQDTLPEGIATTSTTPWHESIPELQEFTKSIFLKNNEEIFTQYIPSYPINKNNPSLLEKLIHLSCYDVLHGEDFELNGSKDGQERKDLSLFIKNLGMVLDATEVILKEKYTNPSIKNWEDYLRVYKITIGEFLDIVKKSVVRANTK